MLNISQIILEITGKNVGQSPGGGGGLGLPYEEYTGVCHELGSYFQEKIPKRVCQFFTKIQERAYNICKKFQIGSVILMTQMTNQKKTELIDFFDLVWPKNPQFLENGLKKEATFSQNSPQNRTLETSIRHKNSEKGPTFSSKIPERVNIETL